MTVRPTRCRFAASLLALALLAACGDDDTESAPEPVAPASVRIDAVVSATGSSFRPGDTELPLELPCDGALVVQTIVENWTLRSPSGCGANAACGPLRVSANGVGTDANLSVSSLAGSTLLRLEAAEFAGRTLITVELLDASGTPYRNLEGDLASTSLELSLTRPSSCSAAPQN